jgi:beta-phosphoglucomutase
MDNVRSILMDLDGVLIDMVANHRKALDMALFDVCGFKLNNEEHEKLFNGLPTKKKLEILTNQNRVNLEDHQIIFQKKQQYTLKIIENEFKPDLEKIKLHTELKSRGLKLACVTNSIKETTDLMLKKTGQFDFMDQIITNEDVFHNKPNSECYITAMVRFGLLPKECVIIEDSDVGYTSAVNTGAHIFKVKGPEEVNWNNFKDYLCQI